ncbi:MAG TPA: hypothetical protein VKB10_02985 [Gaiellaceae bacterium]|nr:hypothetical protein [Gaiellaceae bacterium]
MSGYSSPPPGSNTERPDASYRKGVDPGDVPPSYYEAAEPPLRRLVVDGLRSTAGKVARLWRR